MAISQQVINRDGELWTVSQDESPLLTTIGGYLLIAKDVGLITISTLLPLNKQVEGRNALLRQLAETPLGTIRTIYWSPERYMALQ